MATGKFDLVDIPFGLIFAFASAGALGLSTIPFPFFDLSENVFVLGEGAGSIGFSFFSVLAVVSLLFALYTNRKDISSLPTVEYWVVLATIGLVVAAPFNVIISTILPTTTAAFVAWGIQSSGYFILSYSG